jgi:hypothetical protein
MWKKIIFGVIVAALISGGVYWFSYTKELHTPVSEAINAIPSNAAIIFESKQSKNTWKKLSQNNVMWEGLLGTENFSELNMQGRYIDSLIASNASVAELLDGRSLFISAHVSGATTFDFLYVYSLPNLGLQSSVDGFIKTANKDGKPSIREYSGVDIFTVYHSINLKQVESVGVSKNKDSLSYAFLNGILMMSSKQNLVEDAIRQLKSGVSLAKDKNFSKVINTKQKNVDANVYINYAYFPGILSHFSLPAEREEIHSLSNFANCSGWDVTVKSDALMLSGFTQANDSSTNFLNLFLNQKPQEVELTKIIPSKTALLLFFGISNVKTFHRDYKNYLSAILQGRTRNYEDYIENLNSKYDINIEHSLLEWIGNEMALVITEPSSSDFTTNSYAVIRANAIDDAVSKLNGLSDSISKKDKKKIEVINYKNHTIKHLNAPRLLPQLFGWQFTKVTDNYYTAIDDYIVFANNSGALESFINDFESNKLLANDKNYKAFAENMSTETNVYLYSSIARSPDIYSALVTPDLAADIEKRLDVFHKFEGLGVQFTANTTNKLFYSNVYLKYNPKYKQESGTLWESKLDTTVSSKPYLVLNHNTNAKEIFVQDDANKIYLISSTGKVIWKKQLTEKIMSDVVQVDVLKNNKLQMLFNTSSSIYLLDRNGNEMRGFPVELESPASAAVSVFDYEKNRDYRFFVACENKTIHCFKPNGDEVTSFKFGKTSSQVHLPIQYFNFEEKDYICAVDEKGKIYLLNRQGESRIKIKEELAPATRSFYIEVGKDDSKLYIVAADTLGAIIKIGLSGDKQNIKLQDFDTSPFFDYKDINNDGVKEYIFLTRNELNVFSQDKKSLLFKYEFKSTISKAPLFFNFPDGTGKIGVLSETTDELYLFNNDGSLYKGFPMSGKTGFSIGDINNEGVFNLVTGSSDNSIYMYQLE